MAAYKEDDLTQWKQRFSPSGRPLDYQGSQDWTTRITTRTLCAGGPARTLPTALLFASVGTGIHSGGVLFSEYRMRHFLTSLPSEQGPAAGPMVESESKLKAWFDFELPEWSPIKKLDEEEAKKRALEREYQRHKTLESLHQGTFPAEDH